MFATLGLATALTLAPAQGAGLNITNVRTTYGELGTPRPDSRYLPGDLFFLAFDIEGLALAANGKVSYSMAMQVSDKAGKVILPAKPAEREEYLPLGGNKLPGRAFVFLEPNQAAGTYTCQLTVTDRATKVTKTLEKQFDVLAKDFGIVGLYTSADPKGEHPTPPIGVVGQNLHIHALLIGFGRNKSQQPEAAVQLQIYENGKATVAQPFVAPVPPNINPMDEAVTVYFLVPFNREGTFLAEVKATDRITNKTKAVQFPIRVLPAPR